MANDFLHTFTWDVPADAGFMILCAAEHRHSGAILSGRIVQPYWVIDYSDSDTGLVRVGSTSMPWVERKRSTAHIYAPNTPYWEDKRDMEGPWHGAYVCFQHGEIAGLERFTGGSQPFARIADSDNRILQLLHNAAEVGRQYGHYGLWKAQAELCKLIDLLHSCEYRDDDTWHIKTDTQVIEGELASAVRSYLTNHIDEPITLQDIAGHINVSTSTLSHRYRELAGETPLNTYLALRIEKVKHLLRMGTPLKIIAAQMGFCDIYHLSKTFSRATGMSPRGFLKMDRTNEQ